MGSHIYKHQKIRMTNIDIHYRLNAYHHNNTFTNIFNTKNLILVMRNWLSQLPTNILSIFLISDS